jgi:hypothetical protein
MSWYTQLSPSEKKQFLLGEALRYAVPVMYVDGKEEAVWEWLRFLYERSFGKAAAKIKEGTDADYKIYARAEDDLLSSMINQLCGRRSAPEAAQLFVEACKYRDENRNLIPLTYSWNRLVSSILSLRHKHGLAAKSFDDVFQYRPKYREGTVAFANWGAHLLQVYHPVNPTAVSLAREIRDGNLQDLLHETETSKHRILTSALLDAAQLSLTQGHDQDAQDISKFAAQLVSIPWPQIEKLDDEETLRQMRKEMHTENGTGPVDLALG